MKQMLDDVTRAILRDEIILLGGVALIVLPILNSIDILSIDSDTFWILAGIVISAEALLELYYEKRSIRVSENEEEL